MATLHAQLEELLLQRWEPVDIRASRMAASRFWAEFARCATHGHVTESSELAPLRKDYHADCRCAPDGGSPLDSFLATPFDPKTGLTGLQAPREAWAASAEAARAHAPPAEARRLRAAELADWLAYFGAAFDAVRPVVVEVYQGKRAPFPRLVDYERFLSKVESDASSRRLKHGGPGSLTLGWCTEHGRSGHLFPLGARALYESCFMCARVVPTSDAFERVD